ncbi:MAG: Calx-beta domain-containing protein, partial [Planctomycetota bacterium]
MFRVWFLSIGFALVAAAVNPVLAGYVVLQCDAGEGALQAGWTQVVAGLNSNVAGTGIDVTLATGNFAAIAARDTGGAGPLANVETDLYFANDQMSSPDSDFILTLSNLTPGVGYRLLSYHNRSDEAATVIPGVTVTGATVLSKPPYIVQDHNIMDYPAEFQFVAGAGPVEIRYQGPDGGCAGCQAFFNGFQLQYGSPTITFATDSSGGVETISPALIPVHLSNAEAGQPYAVRYKVIGGTATGGGVDYTLPTGILSFGPGETIKYISIDVVSDGIQEADETIILELFGPLGPGVVLGLSQHTYTISDRPPDVAFGSTASSGNEDVTPTLVQVVLSHASDQTVTVDYSVSGGTALGGGVDYTLLPGTLVFDPCQTGKSISISVVDDSDIEEDETIVLALSNPTNATLGTHSTHTHTIVDDESGVYWDGLIWFYSQTNGGPFVNSEGDLEWDPQKGGQYITRLPEQPFSSAGHKVEMTYWWLTDGDHSCPDCSACPGCYDDDITCVAGIADIRVGLFEADGEYVEQDGLGTSNSIFAGYKGYNFRFGPNMNASPVRWTDCFGEGHRTGNFGKKPVDSSNLMTINEGLMNTIPGFELPPGEWSLFTVSLERTSSTSVRMSITLNGRTYTYTDSSSSGQPTRIDVFGVHMRNGRPYTRLVLDNICEAVADADFNGDDIVDEK